MAYSLDALTEDCYPGTTCLINKLGIQDEEKLAETEAAIVLGKASLLDQQPMAGAFDFAHYKSIHHFFVLRSLQLGRADTYDQHFKKGNGFCSCC